MCESKVFYNGSAWNLTYNFKLVQGKPKLERLLRTTWSTSNKFQNTLLFVQCSSHLHGVVSWLCVCNISLWEWSVHTGHAHIRAEQNFLAFGVDNKLKLNRTVWTMYAVTTILVHTYWKIENKTKQKQNNQSINQSICQSINQSINQREETKPQYISSKNIWRSVCWLIYELIN